MSDFNEYMWDLDTGLSKAKKILYAIKSDDKEQERQLSEAIHEIRKARELLPQVRAAASWYYR